MGLYNNQPTIQCCKVMQMDKFLAVLIPACLLKCVYLAICAESGINLTVFIILIKPCNYAIIIAKNKLQS